MRVRPRIVGALATLAVAAGATPFLLPSSHADAAAFTGGSLVVYRVGTAGGTLSNAAAPVFLDEYSRTGTKLQSTDLPTSAANGNLPLTASGLSRSEGLISRSPDGRYVALTGYAATPGTTGPTVAGTVTSLTNSSVASVPRVVGLVDHNGNVDTSTTLGASAPSIVRSAATDGDRIYAAGGSGGLLTTTLGSTTVSGIGTGSTPNLNQVSFQSNNASPKNPFLFTSAIATGLTSATRLAEVGAGSPSSTTTPTDLPGLPDNLLSYGYALLDLTSQSWNGTGLDTLYLADASNRAGTVDKYRWNGNSWGLAGFLDLPGVTGLVSDISGTTVSLAVTTPTSLSLITDANAASSTLPTTAPTNLATASPGTEFRGLALAPTDTATGPSTFVRSPATGTQVSTAASGVPVSVYAPGATSVTLKLGSNTAPTTLSGGVFSGIVPIAGLGAGAQTLTVIADTGATSTVVTRSVTLVAPPTPPTTPPTTTPPTTTPPKAGAPAGSLTAGTYAPSVADIKKAGSWKSYKTKSSPTGKGIVAKKKKSKVTATVYGSGLVLTFDKTNTSGEVAVTIDGKTKTFSLFSPKLKKTLKSFSLGAPGAHTVTITVVGKKSAKSKGIAVSLAAVQVK